MRVKFDRRTGLKLLARILVIILYGLGLHLHDALAASEIATLMAIIIGLRTLINTEPPTRRVRRRIGIVSGGGSRASRQTYY